MALTQLTKVDGGGISTTSDYRVGIITASKFVGPFDGTAGNFSGVVTATNGVFSGNISAVDGTFSGNVSIAGTLTYEDVTNIDSVGIVTAQKDIHVGAGLSVVGVSTLTGRIFAGGTVIPGYSGADDLTIGTESGNHGITIRSSTTGGGGLFFSDATSAGDNSTQWAGGLEYSHGNGELRFYQGGTVRGMFQGSGHFTPYIDSTGALGTTSKRWSNVHADAATIAGDIDVDGHTNLDNVSIAGVTTTDGNAYFKGNFIELNNSADSQYTLNKGGTQLFSIRNNSTAGVHINTQNSALLALGVSTGSNNGSVETTLSVNYQGRVGIRNIYPAAVLDVNGETHLDNVIISGVTTTTGNIDANGDLDVDGHTNLDNVSIVGVTTFSTSPIATNGTYYKGIINSGSQAKIVGGYISGSDTLRLGESMYLTSTGLGIGVASPSRKLDVSGDILGNAFMLKSNTSASPSIQAQMYRPENNTLAFATNGNQERLRIKSDGKVLITNTLGLGGATSSPSDLLHAQTASGEGKIVLIGATDGTVAISALNGDSSVKFGDSSTENAGNITYDHGSDSLSFRVNGNTRWKFDSSGHFLPDAVGSYNIGSTSAEIGDVYVADDKKLQIGSSQDLQIYHTNSGTSWIRHTNSSEYFILEGNQMDFRDYATGVYRARMGTAVQLYYNGNNVKLATTNTGVTVTGEVAATQDYPMVKPTLDCNFVLNKKLDPRIGYTRKGVASFYDEQGILKIVGDNVPRFDHNPETRESLGILIEEERTNNQPHSEQWSSEENDLLNVISGMDVDINPGVVTPTGETTGAITFMETGASGQHYIAFDVFGATVSGTSYTFSFFFKNISGGGSGNANNVKVITTTAAFPYMIRTFYFDGPDAGTTNSPSDSTITKLPNGWWRGTFTATANNNFASAAWTMDLRGLNGGAAYNNKIAIWGIQTETGEFPTSYIRTGNSDYGRTATRGVDFLQIQGQAFTDLYNPVESTILCSYQHTREVGSINADLGTERRVYRFGTGGTSSDTRIDFVSTSTFNPYIARDGSGVASLTATAPTKTAVNTYATRVKEDDFATTKAGGSIVSDTSGNWDPVNKMTEVQIGGTFNASSISSLQAHFKRFTYYPVGLPNSQLITISS